MKIYITAISSLFLMLIVVGCAKDEEVVSQNATSQEVEVALQTYFDAFKSEADQRGVKVDYTSVNISGYIQDINTKGVIGQCMHKSDGTSESSKVTIDQNYWRNASQLERELVVFHELGHCILKREHDESSSRGICNSIMHSGTGSCRLRYTTATRTQYLDELFSK